MGGSNVIFSGYSVNAAQNEGFLKSRLSPICEVRWGVSEAGRPFQQDEGLELSISLMEFLSAVTEDKFHQVISAKGNASKLVTILSNNSGQVGQGQRCQNSIPLSGSKTLD